MWWDFLVKSYICGEIFSSSLSTDTAVVNFREDPFSSFYVKLLTDRQTERQTVTTAVNLLLWEKLETQSFQESYYSCETVARICNCCCQTLKEPVELWTDIDGHNGLVRTLTQCNFISVVYMYVICIHVKYLSCTESFFANFLITQWFIITGPLAISDIT